jgi:Zn-dependent membrane protease YugP
MYMPFDSTFLLLVPALLLSLYAQFKVTSTFRKYSNIEGATGKTGARVARELLDRNGLSSVPVEVVPGNLSDHYDPRAKVLRLSPDVYNGSSLAALGVAAHETGHAVQHAQSYLPLKLRSLLFLPAQLGSQLGLILFMVGLFFTGSDLLLKIGILLFTAFVAFTFITLPVEFNASSRALATLTESGYLLQGEQAAGARRVLNAAALTYVAAALMAVMQLLRLILLFTGRRND